MTRRTQHKASRLGRQLVETMVAAPQVVAHRTGRMLMSGASPSAADRREMHTMGHEKISAFFESWAAMATQTMAAQFQMASAMLQMPARSLQRWMPSGLAAHALSMAEMTRWGNQIQSVALDVASKGLAPVHRRAVANATRMRRKGA